MIKILHAADLHLDSAFAGRGETATERLRVQLRAIPDKITALCKRESCDLLLLAGDVFDGAYTPESCAALKNALEEVAIPVFISPGNHDFCGTNSPWQREIWPSNVHVFLRPTVESVAVTALDCRIYGAGFAGTDCAALLDHFEKTGTEAYQIGLFHGDATQSCSPYNPISQGQVAACGVDYLALGHIHKNGDFRAGRTLCAWPGCPMGRGYDETGEKGVLIVTLDGEATAKFVPLDTPQFYDREATVTRDAEEAVARLLPGAGDENFYRITLVGVCEKPDLSALYRRFSAFPNLELRDRTQPPVDIWGNAGEDSLEGLYFKLLRQRIDTADPQGAQAALLAAQISRTILNGSEVALP